MSSIIEYLIGLAVAGILYIVYRQLMNPNKTILVRRYGVAVPRLRYNHTK